MTTDKRPLDVAELREHLALYRDHPLGASREYCWDLLAAAAAEIERLRAENATLGEAFTSAKERADRWIDDAAKYKAENEKLRALLGKADDLAFDAFRVVQLHGLNAGNSQPSIMKLERSAKEWRKWRAEVGGG